MATSIFVEIWRKVTEVIIKFSESVSCMKYYHSEKRKANKLEKRSSCGFYLVIAPRYFLEQLFK